MPDFWTHLIAGEEIAAEIKDEKIKNLINNNYQLFNYGCQGGDFFFYNNFLPWQRAKLGPEKGEMIHSLSGRKLFAELLTAFKKEAIYLNSELPDSKLGQYKLVYLLGFISHYALDRECHPFIIKNGGEGKKHKLIEASIDIYIMQSRWKQNPKAVNPLPYYQLQKEHLESLNYFYQLIFANIFEENLDKNLIWDSYQDLRKYHKLFSTENSLKYHLFRSLNLILPQNLSQYVYALNEKKKIWPVENYQQFENYFERGVEAAQILISQTLGYFQSENSLSEILTLFSDKNFLGE
jgi:hypothetical protein